VATRPPAGPMSILLIANRNLERMPSDREIKKFIIRQPPIGEKYDYDSENYWISDGRPSSSRRRRRGDGRGEGGE